MTGQQSYRLQFSGDGSEYFRIWIVNVCLSIVTLGIYSAWAKVRRNQYFYRHTSLAGASFDYHGDPKVILKGRAVAFTLFLAYSLAGQFSPFTASMIMLLIMAIMPWLLVRSFRFRLHNTSYRGLRFAFHGSYGQAYFNFLLWPLLATFSLGLLWPVVKQRIERYLRENSRYGQSGFKFTARASAYYGVYTAIFFMTLLILVLVAVGFWTCMALLKNTFQLPVPAEGQQMVAGVFIAIGLYLTMFMIIYPYAVSRLQNLIWNATMLGEDGFRSSLQARGLAGIMFSNLVLIILTFGLYKPYADIRLARYRLEHLEFLANGNIDDFVAGQQTNASAVGDEMADMFDLDIAL